MKISGIYQIQSKVKPKRIYIGSAVNISDRWRRHKGDLKQGIHGSKKLQRHYDKYTKDDLVFIIIEPCLPEFLITREQFYIDTLTPYFNSRPIADSQLGFRHSEETIRKMTGRKMSEEACIHMRKPKTKEHIKKVADSKRGKKQSTETIEKRVSKLRGKKRPPEISQSLKGNKHALGYKATKEQRKNNSEAHKGLNTWTKGVSRPKDVCDSIGETMKIVWAKRKANKKTA